MRSLSETSAIERAEQLVTEISVDGIRVRMRGDKILVGLDIPAEILLRRRREDLEKTLEEAINRARTYADYRSARLYSELTGLSEILDEMPELPPETDLDERHMVVPELVAGIRSLLEERGFMVADLAARSGLGEDLLGDLLLGRYNPFEAIKGRRDLAATMDLVAPVARAFEVSPRQLWRRGRAKIEEFERTSRTRIRKMVRGFERRKEGRRTGGGKREKLMLGNLIALDVMSERELDLRVKEENLIEMLRCHRDWLKWSADTEWRDGDDFGCLVGPSGEILRPSIEKDDFQRLKELDQQALADPASISDADLEWVRSLLGMPALMVVAAS